jgi:outer membrane protein assembly factor BamB
MEPQMNADERRLTNHGATSLYLRASACICGYLLSAMSFAQSPGFTPPAETFMNKNQLSPLQQALEQKQYADAAERVDALMHDSADQLMGIEGGSLVSVRLWVESLPPAVRQAVMADTDKLVGEQARAAVDTAALRPNRRPEDLLAAAADWPLATAHRDALAAAAMRAIDLGDVGTTLLLVQRAKDLGWKPSAAQQQTLDALKPATGGAASLAVATPWYTQSPPAAAKRVIPVIAGNTIFISTERAVIATKLTGELLWQYVAPKADPLMTAAKNGFHRPTVVCDLAGQPQLVIVRQVIGATRFGCLRAFRASDGKMLWSSDGTPALAGLSLATTPAVSGRCAWVLAADETQRPAPLMLVAVEVMTGRLVTQTQLGTFQNDGGDSGADMEKLWNSSGVAIDGGDVFVSAGSGLIVRVDRLDGKIRWLRTYPSMRTPGEQVRDLARQAMGNNWEAGKKLKKLVDELRTQAGEPPPPRLKDGEKASVLPDDALKIGDLFSQQVRWMNTPTVAGNVVVVAAADSENVLGLDRSNGAILWENAELAKQTLVGTAGSMAILAGDGITGVESRTGKAKWTWSDGKPEGPPAVSGGSVRVPTGGKVIVLSAETGQTDQLTAVGPAIAPLLKHEQSKAALTGAEAISSLTPRVGPPKK